MGKENKTAPDIAYSPMFKQLTRLFREQHFDDMGSWKGEDDFDQSLRKDVLAKCYVYYLVKKDNLNGEMPSENIEFLQNCSQIAGCDPQITTAHLKFIEEKFIANLKDTPGIQNDAIA